MSDVSELLRLLTKNEQCEGNAQFAHQKWATMSDMLRLLTKNERMSDFLKINQQLAPKTDERISNPGSALHSNPALVACFQDLFT